ncbi:GSCOCG00001570001-RA-CDS, partial [Cotesia congregata]
MLIHEQCQLDDFALTVVRDFLNEFNSEKVFENIFKNKALIVESFQTIGDFVNHLERREKNNITITHFFIKIIMSTIKKAFDASVHNNLTNFKAQLYVSMVLELNKSLKTIKETLDFLITQLFDSLVDASQCVDIRLKRSIERHEYIILYGLEITIKKFCEMISCEMVKTKLQDSSTKITAFWRRQLIAHFDPTFNEPRVIPEDDLKEFLIISLKKLLGTYKSMNP